MKIFLRLILLALTASVLNIYAGEIGTAEGGHCESCSVWIEEVRTDGGTIYTAIASGILEGNYADEIVALGQASCKLKGLGEPIFSKDWLIHMGFWKQTRARNYACRKPNVYVENEGLISSIRTNDFEVQQVAENYCRSKNIRYAVITAPPPNSLGLNDSLRGETRYFYKYYCSATDMAKSTSQEEPRATIESQVPSNSQSEDVQKMTMSKAKETCEGLGFKPKTEKFGNCVLRLTK